MINPFIKIERERRRIGIFGGTFDPPTIGHLHLLEQALAHLKLDAIWVVPNGRPHGKSPTATYKQRLAWCSYSFQNMPKVWVRALETDEGDEPHYTWRTMKTLTELHPTYDFTLLMGSDQWENFPNWAEADYLASLVDIAVLDRDDQVSSTAVRTLLADENYESARRFLHKVVFEHLRAEKTYAVQT